MKKIVVLISLVLIGFIGYGQISQPNPFPNYQQLGSATTWLRSNGAFYSFAGIVNAEYADTTSANVNPIRLSPGAQIRVGNRIYYRNSTATGWVEFAAGAGVGTVTSVGLSMPSAFTVTNSPVTGSGTLAVTGSGTTAQYIRGDGSLASVSSLVPSIPATRVPFGSASNLLTTDADFNVTLEPGDDFSFRFGGGSTSGANNIFMGLGAGGGATGLAQVAIGSGALGNMGGNSISGAVAIGGGSLDAAIYANDAVGIGTQALANADSCFNCIGIGLEVARNASHARDLIAVGFHAAENATYAFNSIAIGRGSLQNAFNGSHTIALGEHAGTSFSGNEIGTNNIIIGTNISVINAGTNRLNIGGVLFGTGLHSDTAGNASITPEAGGRIGIGTVSPAATLHVAGSSGSTLRIVDGNQGANRLLISDADGDASWSATIPSPLIPTWQQTLTAGSAITLPVSITGGSNDFEMTGFGDFDIVTTGVGRLSAGTNQGTFSSFFSTTSGGNGATIESNNAGAAISNIGIVSTGITIRPQLGNILIDTLPNLSTQNRLIGWTQGTVDNGEVGYVTIGSGLSLSGGQLTASGGNQSSADIVILGTSIEAPFSCHSGINTFLMTPSDSAAGTTITNLAAANNTIQDMIDDWSAYGSKATADVIYIGGPANDCDPAENSATTLARYQRLIDSINLYKKASAKILVGSILPCDRSLLATYGAGGPLKRDTLNLSLAGGSNFVLTGIEYHVDQYNPVIGTPSGELLRALDCGDGIHQTDGASKSMAGIIRQQIVAMGYLGNTPPLFPDIPVNAVEVGADSVRIYSQFNNNRSNLYHSDLAGSSSFPAARLAIGHPIVGITSASFIISPRVAGSAFNFILSNDVNVENGGSKQFFIAQNAAGTSLNMYGTTALGAGSPPDITIGGTIGFAGPLKVNATTFAVDISNILGTTGGLLMNASRIQQAQGADVASAAGAITLGVGGNSFEITGTASITLISNLYWQNGSEVCLVFTSTATLTDGTANSGTDIGMELAGNTNFTAAAGQTITLRLLEVGGTQRWREVGRSLN